MPTKKQAHAAFDHALTHVVRRNAVARDEAEEFTSWATLKFIENDYRILRRFKERSKLSTYLITVATRLFLDFHNARWGKWRPSVGAKRLGPIAVELETLVYRDGHTFQDAVVLVRERSEVELDDDALEKLFGQIKPRTRRTFQGEEAIESMSAATNPEDDAIDRDLECVAEDLSNRLSSALAQLEPNDSVLLRLRFGEGMKVSDVARQLDLDQRQLYSRCNAALKKLKRAILDSGVSEEQIRDLLGWDQLELKVDYGDVDPALHPEVAVAESRVPQ